MIEKLSKQNGGATVYNPEGYWDNSSEELGQEKVKVAVSYGDEKKDDLADNLARKIKKELNQESVSYVVDGVMRIV